LAVQRAKLAEVGDNIAASCPSVLSQPDLYISLLPSWLDIRVILWLSIARNHWRTDLRL